jgi:uncharacterized membrane protein YqaE (UPF0057 family)
MITHKIVWLTFLGLSVCTILFPWLGVFERSALRIALVINVMFFQSLTISAVALIYNKSGE